MTWRELRTFIRHLPRDSAYIRAELGEEADWDVAEYLLARIANILLQAHSSRRVPEAKLIHPPGAAAAKARTQPAGGAAELDALFTGR